MLLQQPELPETAPLSWARGSKRPVTLRFTPVAIIQAPGKCFSCLLSSKLPVTKCEGLRSAAASVRKTHCLTVQGGLAEQECQVRERTNCQVLPFTQHKCSRSLLNGCVFFQLVGSFQFLASVHVPSCEYLSIWCSHGIWNGGK